MIDKRKQGKRNKAAGAAFERLVRADLEARGFFVCKWMNQVDLMQNRLIAAKHKFNFFTKVMTIGTGFPDFIAFSRASNGLYTMCGVECKGGSCKSSTYLDAEEKAKAKWLLEHNVFDSINIAVKKKEGRKIVPDYIPFEQ